MYISCITYATNCWPAGMCNTSLIGPADGAKVPLKLTRHHILIDTDSLSLSLCLKQLTHLLTEMNIA